MDNHPSAPIANPIEETANDYLQIHRIHELFHNLSASMVYNRPEDPKAFMIDYLEQLKKSRATGLAFPALVQDTDLTSVFRILDPVGLGHITYSQYASTMENLGITKYNTTPVGKDADQISSETFCQEAKKRLNELNATFHNQ
ncbi:unnamed protein product [Rotaria magnacalcarata]|uniref:EFCAB10 C-terminal EF-hand domain-containing protein n=1 Tax=Rotaria magnacalcarata TaxID=392030 RepID=A0A815WW85_9BILA|nr:unnamed protein product [Rotaria magnacalcarata]CAF1550579.1 unnamed protein product [Rotaria magnacalcarata]CAF1930712.1 unnamed protein product [Rotaria magnacalcarata]CAF2073847.1 unnamed protein product [Rotaria magnacalcarata]CAF2078167.1 unnamed protein product [Rotaria magnacalcarata]